jgi:hypothetical protein
MGVIILVLELVSTAVRAIEEVINTSFWRSVSPSISIWAEISSCGESHTLLVHMTRAFYDVFRS